MDCLIISQFNMRIFLNIFLTSEHLQPWNLTHKKTKDRFKNVWHAAKFDLNVNAVIITTVIQIVPLAVADCTLISVCTHLQPSDLSVKVFEHFD